MPRRAKAIVMLKHFTWQQFLIAALILSSIWYLVVLPLWYRRQLKEWLGNRKGRLDKRPVNREWEDELEDKLAADEEPDNLMGKSKLPDGVSRVPVNGFGFVQTEVSEDAHDRLLGLVPDALARRVKRR